ncbi:response regulator transcription factor [Sutcliffiella cohnii]
MIHILLVEDQLLVRQGLNLMIEQDEQMTVVAEAGNGKEAVELYEKHIVDVVLMDIRMPEMNGLEATKLLKKQYPNAIILILTTFEDDEYVMEALKLGAAGFLLKTADARKLRESIQTAYEGGIMIDATVAAKVVPKLFSKNKMQVQLDPSLTSREISILKLVGEGKNNQEIADALFLSIGTVKNNITHMLQKLYLRDRTQLAIYAIKSGLCE